MSSKKQRPSTSYTISITTFNSLKQQDKTQANTCTNGSHSHTAENKWEKNHKIVPRHKHENSICTRKTKVMVLNPNNKRFKRIQLKWHISIKIPGFPTEICRSVGQISNNRWNILKRYVNSLRNSG